MHAISDTDCIYEGDARTGQDSIGVSCVQNTPRLRLVAPDCDVFAQTARISAKAPKRSTFGGVGTEYGTNPDIGNNTATRE